jgi:FeS assembly protein IscX
LDDIHPDVDPRSVSLTDLHRWVCELKEFDDDPSQPEQKLLEAIKKAWIEERE